VAEGVTKGIHVCGDVMYDLFLRAREAALDSLSPDLRAAIREPYVLLTLHRAENTDDRVRLAAIVAGFLANPPAAARTHPRGARLRCGVRALSARDRA
jgi:UDP-N-acetylglucosamine 2-epimerase